MTAREKAETRKRRRADTCMVDSKIDCCTNCNINNRMVTGSQSGNNAWGTTHSSYDCC